MVTRWDVTKAVRASELPAPSRLIMLTLADVAEVGTAEIPERYTPSIAVLSTETGLDKSTVKRHLSSLEISGWIERNRPDKKAQWHGERTRYRLTLPEGVEPPGVGAQEATLGADSPQGRRTESPGVGAQEDLGRRTERHLETDLSDQSQITTDHISSGTPPAPPDPPREDVDRICAYLAEWIVKNGGKRPTITKRWRAEARLLIDRDRRPLDEIRDVIAWSQKDGFWKANILSVPKLREKYDQLRLAAQRTPVNARAAHRPFANPDPAEDPYGGTL